MLSDKEKKAEQELLNPLAKKMGKIMAHVAREKVRSFLCNDDIQAEIKREMFE